MHHHHFPLHDCVESLPSVPPPADSAFAMNAPSSHGTNIMEQQSKGLDSRPSDVAPTSRLVVHRRTDRSLLMRIVLFSIRQFKPMLVKTGKVQPEGSPRLDPAKAARKWCNVRERQVDGIWIYDMTPRDSAVETSKKKTKRLFYLAGGGWQMPPSPDHFRFVAYIATQLEDTTVTVVSYPLAPKSPAAVAMPQLKAWYETIMSEAAAAGERVVFAGDSSGANIALCLVIWALTHAERSALLPAPAAVMAISPSTDLRHLHADISAISKRDPLLTQSFINTTANAWSGQSEKGDPTPPKSTASENSVEWTVADPRLSPILADLDVLVRNNVKVHGVTGTHDVLCPEALAFRDKCRDAGVEGQWLEWEGQMHCFPLASRYKLKESVEGRDWIIEVLRKT